MATIVNRVDTSVGDYLNEMKDHLDIQNLLAAAIFPPFALNIANICFGIDSV